MNSKRKEIISAVVVIVLGAFWLVMMVLVIKADNYAPPTTEYKYVPSVSQSGLCVQAFYDRWYAETVTMNNRRIANDVETQAMRDREAISLPKQRINLQGELPVKTP